MHANPFRDLPAVHELVADPCLRSEVEQFGHEAVVQAIRCVLQEMRDRLRSGDVPAGAWSPQELGLKVRRLLEHECQPNLRRVINATGIVLHTNLGRAPMAASAARAACEAAQRYVNLEMDLESGARSHRQGLVRGLLARLTGAESATVVNNNAAATIIALRALAKGKEVIVSRSELVEIGGSFRLPEIMAVSGAILREVGTTNITRIEDYAAAVSEQTGLLLRVHPSNYRIMGHTAAPTLRQLVDLGRARQLPVIDDLGSGALIDFARWGFHDEPLARRSLEEGADLVLCSGDKLLGGPQAGLIAGRGDLIQRIEKDPLMRAVRMDKMALAALEATLRAYHSEEEALKQIPILAMLETNLEQLQDRAHGLAHALQQGAIPGCVVDVRDDTTYLGGGSTPMQSLPTVVCAIQSEKIRCHELAYRLRIGTPAVLPRIQKDWLLLDLRTIFPEEVAEVAKAVQHALREPPR